MITEMSLLDVLSIRMNCLNLSDLKYLNNCGRAKLCRIISEIPEDDAPCSEWNDALQYLTGDNTAQASASEAKEALITGLSKNTESCLICSLFHGRR